MYARGQIDISWSDLAFGLTSTLRRGGADAAARRAAAAWHPDAVSFLTLRTGWDLLLAALALPRGSEVVCTAVNIPDMFELLEHHGLVPVPVDLDPATLAPQPSDVRAALTEKTALVLVIHLVGARVEMGPIHALARERGLPVVEDCAQAFDGQYTGHPDSLVSMFSFGPIKTATALGGGLFRVRDDALRERLWSSQRDYPVQTRAAWLSVVANYSAMKALSSEQFYGAFVWTCTTLGTSHDKVINGRVLGLKGDDWWAALRRRPSAPLMSLLERRLTDGTRAQLDARTRAGDALLSLLPTGAVVLGRGAKLHSWWQFCVVTDRPDAVIAALRREGFDATAGASRLRPCSVPEGRPAPSRIDAAMSRVVYVPAYAGIGDAARGRLGRALSAVLSEELAEAHPVPESAAPGSEAPGSEAPGSEAPESAA
jgi:perosamine synthetase